MEATSFDLPALCLVSFKLRVVFRREIRVRIESVWSANGNQYEHDDSETYLSLKNKPPITIKAGLINIASNGH